MNAIITLQLLAQTKREGQVWKKQCDQLASTLDALSETLCGKHCSAAYYAPGELIDAQEGCPALRWVLVISMSKRRLEALQEFLRGALPLLTTQVPYCTLQWKIEPLDFLP